MQNIHADMSAIIALANELDQYQSSIHQQYSQLSTTFTQLGNEGKWADARYLEFNKQHMETLANELSALSSLVDNELKPYLRDVYQKLSTYRDA